MYGTLLDQRVFEALVEKTMPILWEHLVKSDVQLSVVSLPWFLSLYINSMPLVFAFRVLDVFFLEGPKVLFQIGLAILRINGEELLDITDDGTFISVLKTYFSKLEESAHPKSENEKLRSVTKFQELMVVAFKEFAGITQNTISEQRGKHKAAVLDNIESFAKRTSIRNLGPDSKRLSVDDLGFLYDRFYGILYEREQRLQVMREEADRRATVRRNKATELVTGLPSTSSIEIGRVGLGPSPTLMNYDGFREFLAGITRWAITDAPTSRKDSVSEDGSIYSYHSGTTRSASSFLWGAANLEPADHDFMQRLYGKWNKDDNDGLSLQDVVTGLAQVKGTMDIMTSITYFFDLYDDDHDGKVDREGILRISEALLFLTRRGLGGSTTPSSTSISAAMYETTLDSKNGSTDERFLGSVSAFIRRCFEYADPDHPQNQGNSVTISAADSHTSMDKFAVGDSDSEEDLLDLENSSPTCVKEAPSAPASAPSLPHHTPSTSPPIPKPQAKNSANVALDPSNPLYMTLPTFRMVILADDLLQQFFESAFPSSFHLSSHPARSSSQTTLTTFSSPVSALPTGPRDGIVPPAKGLRGVLDNIVSDGMRVAGEAKKRFDDAQREMERSAVPRTEVDEDEEERGAYGGESDRRSVREVDRELLEGEEAVVGVGKGGNKETEEDLLMETDGGLSGGGTEGRGKVEFER